ncbi:hypothetical protein H696_01491 [Fonticula alba]|uniref:Uncharacterized protein n=1 Tax=Fonticula alba TaxID=691883 RepID=A0A058ZDT0_FONAL|nr:hypothetical protein H696_01491 [Fonticula alba]KCV72083.1 hypothetical protein H696_01491 [Fonticula alba]|eukprot:XP_009493661.1 hypothetical protein H696_01491 [Fonticula alba]
MTTCPDATTASPHPAPSSAMSGLASRIDGQMEKTLLEPYTYLTSTPGKNVRSMLIEAFNLWLRVPAEALEVVKEVVEMLHNSSLLIDDIQDGSSLRRGLPAAHLIYGPAQTINCANYVYFRALEKLLALSPEYASRCVVIYTKELCNLHRGQGMDLFWRDSVRCPSETEYLHMIDYKTGGLLRLGVKLMQVFSSYQGNLIPLVNLIGIHFQIRDDYVNLSSSSYQKNKGYCEDITEGKFSFLISHSVRTASDTQLLNILKQRTAESELLDYAVSCVRRTGTFAYTRRYLERVEAAIRDEIARQPPVDPSLLADLTAQRSRSHSQSREDFSVAPPAADAVDAAGSHSHNPALSVIIDGLSRAYPTPKPGSADYDLDLDVFKTMSQPCGMPGCQPASIAAQLAAGADATTSGPCASPACDGPWHEYLLLMQTAYAPGSSSSSSSSSSSTS